MRGDTIINPDHAPDNSLPKWRRVCNRDAIQKGFNSLLLTKGRWVIVRAVENMFDYSRVATIAGKSTGNAVVRNRGKRLLRSIYRQNKSVFTAGYDWLLILRGSWQKTGYEQLTNDILTAVKQLKINDQ